MISFFVKRTALNRVPFCSSNYCFKPPCSNINLTVPWSFMYKRVWHNRDHRITHWLSQDDGMGMNKIAWWVSSLLSCPEQNEQKFVASSQRYWRHPGEKVRQPKLLRMIKWCKMAQLCCYTLNQSDGNSSVRLISCDAAGKVQQVGPKRRHCQTRVVAFSNVRPSWGSCWDGLRLSV